MDRQELISGFDDERSTSDLDCEFAGDFSTAECDVCSVQFAEYSGRSKGRVECVCDIGWEVVEGGARVEDDV